MPGLSSSTTARPWNSVAARRRKLLSSKWNNGSLLTENRFHKLQKWRRGQTWQTITLQNLFRVTGALQCLCADCRGHVLWWRGAFPVSSSTEGWVKSLCWSADALMKLTPEVMREGRRSCWRLAWTQDRWTVGLAEAQWAEIRDTFAFCFAEDADSGWTDARHPSENFQECSCFGLFKFCQFLTQVVSTCCLYVGMLPRSTWQVYYYASQAPTFRVCHKTLQRFRRFHDSQWKPGADGMDPELHWYGCHPRNTDLVDLASGGIGENIQSVCHMAW